MKDREISEILLLDKIEFVGMLHDICSSRRVLITILLPFYCDYVTFQVFMPYLIMRILINVENLYGMLTLKLKPRSNLHNSIGLHITVYSG